MAFVFVIYGLFIFIVYWTEADSELSQTSKMKAVNYFGKKLSLRRFIEF